MQKSQPEITSYATKDNYIYEITDSCTEDEAVRILSQKFAEVLKKTLGGLTTETGTQVTDRNGSIFEIYCLEGCVRVFLEKNKRNNWFNFCKTIKLENTSTGNDNKVKHELLVPRTLVKNAQDISKAIRMGATTSSIVAMFMREDW